MDLAAVQALLGGNGQAIAETEVAGSKAQVFSWKTRTVAMPSWNFGMGK
ncbi:MAG: hypothetical protein HC918_13190 [Oscillatoriales cyanobacterium SM2_1_8]|nr:hypothetical protein [Oscillatoriales cyanobacterium SM2_1_8]